MQLTQRRGTVAHFSIAGTECERKKNEERVLTRKVSSGAAQDLEIMVRIQGDLPCNKGKQGKISEY